MKIIIGSSLWILGWAVILNSIGLSSQSETPRLPVDARYREDGINYTALSMKSGVPIETLKRFDIPDLPIRRVDCPSPFKKTWNQNFRLKNRLGIYEPCKSDSILLAIGPVTFGYILHGEIKALANIYSQEILYDERYDKQIVLDRDYVINNFNIGCDVPEDILNSRHTDKFGLYIPTSPTGASPVSESCLGSTSGSRTPRRSPRKFFSKIFSCSSSHSSKRPSGGGSSSR